MASSDRFGAFFRAKRQALGLSLREFCARHGFDPGNVSRLERGLLVPPQSAELLQSYADALKLVPDSADWRRFMDLAAIETAPLLPKDSSTQKALLRTLQKLGERNRRPWIDVGELTQWADRLDARAQLPRLIRRLVHATAQSLERIEIPAGEGSQRRGWDGMVVARAASPFVPAGLSVWEFGVSADPRKKAEEDFRTRKANPLGVTPSDAAFVFVTPRRWEGKAEWELKKNQPKIWREVRVYDADSLEVWLEAAPAVDVWFARMLGIPTDGMLDAGAYWNSLADVAEPSLLPNIFLISREQEKKALEQWLDGAPSSLAIEARAPAEVIDFLAAYLASLEDKQRRSRSSRVVIVETKEAWNMLAREASSLTLVAKPEILLEAESVAEAVRNGHHVLLCSDRLAVGQSQSLVLSRVNVYDLERALVECGFEEDEAHRRALDCSGSLTVLKRRISRFPATMEPEWAHSEVAAELAPLTLFGSWNQTSSRDQSAITAVIRREYSELAALVGRALTFADPPLIRFPDNISLTSREDSWILLGRHLRSDQLEAWQRVAVEVLSVNDPKLDLPEEEWIPHSLMRHEQQYSKGLRHGIAESLAILATRPGELGPQLDHAADRAAAVVRKVLGGAPGWKRWASLEHDLPLLAEASPEEFLSALEAELSSADSDIMEMFGSADDSLLSRCLHAGLLWALETLAWSPQLLCRTSIVLARLAERDTGRSNWQNRPASSLREIYLPWYAQTAAGVDERIRVLRTICKKCPASGWRLLLELLPNVHDSSSDTAKPRWRDWTSRWRRGVTNADYHAQVEACGELLLELAGSKPERWEGLIESIGNLPPKARDQAITRLSSVDLSTLAPDQRTSLAERIRQQVHQHRRFSDAEWALPADVVSQLEAALEHIEPDDPVVRNVWLFTKWPELPERLDHEHSMEQEERGIARRRKDALAEVFQPEQMNGLLRLVDSAEAPWTVGDALARSKLLTDDRMILPEMLVDDVPARIDFARGYTAARFESRGTDWIASMKPETWNAKQVASLALALPAGQYTWQLVEGHSSDASKEYWDKVSHLVRFNGVSEIEHAVTMLLSRNRPIAAIDAIRMALHDGLPPRPELLLNVLQACLEDSGEHRANAVHGLRLIFQHLQSGAASVDESQLAKFEWAYLPLLDGRRASPVTLRRELSTTPQFFANLIAIVFRARSDTEPATEPPTEEQKRRAENAYRLLRRWKDIPGLDPETGTLDEDALHKWVGEARRICQESDRLEICDSQIGELLANAPQAADGTWPCIPVRDLIDEIETDAIVSGFVVGRLNKRGAVWKSPMDGREQERTLADEYFEYARACDAEWPRTAAALRKIARSHERDARREDSEAHARRLGRW